MDIYHHTIFVGQETESSLAGFLWLKVSRDIAIHLLVRTGCLKIRLGQTDPLTVST